MIATAFQQLLHLGIEFVELLISVLDAKMELWHALLDSGNQRSSIRSQQLDSLFVEVVQDEQAFDVERRHPLCLALDVELLRRDTKLVDEDQRRPRAAALVSAAARKTIDNGKTKPGLLGKLAAHSQIARDVFGDDLMLAS
ncbi:hypothetical protein HNQ36_001741 [Afipia massiliensis]|uniref:Uncharacterized protein n=1 Tax=Afipia massiliensis TaxID=211460 RepID=A0A840MZZ2_9BRAD|nr:hypothetical protein [Afipia massiliensis]